LDTGLSAIVPSQKRSVTIVCDGEDVNGIIKPGNRVDIIGVFDYSDGANHTQQIGVTVLQNILVLAAGKEFMGSASGEKKDKKSDSPNFETEASRVPVSLALTPQESELLILAQNKGTIKFALRGMGDDVIANTAGVKIQDILHDSSAISATKATESHKQDADAMRDMQQKQKEALELLKKYQK